MTRSRKRKLRRTHAKWVRLPLASAMLAGSVANAQTTTDAAESTGALQEITVTAEKRAEDLQKVPISLTVLSTEKISQLQINSFDDYAKFLPSVSYQSLGPGQAELYFRGIATGGDGLHAGSLPATGTYLDEIPVTTIGNTLDIHAYDIQRIEALAGPQGTLYGASSLSGTLRIITNKPDSKAFSASYDIKADKFGRGNGGGTVEGYINIPLIEDKLAIRLVGFYDHQGGYINTVYSQDTLLFGAPYGGIPNTPETFNNASNVKPRQNPVDTYGGRAALKFDLNDNWTIMPQLLAQGQQAQGEFSFDPKKGDLNEGDYYPENNQDRWYQSALTVEGKIANFDLVYSGGWFERKVDNTVDYSGYTIGYDHQAQLPGYAYNYDHITTPAGDLIDPFQYTANHDKYTKMSHELRVSSPQDFPFRATAGLFYQRQTDLIRAEYRTIGELPAAYAIDGSPGILYLSNQIRADRDYAAFTELNYDLTSQVKLTGGIRRFWVNNTLYGFFGFNAGGSGEGSCNPPVSAATIVPNYWPCINVNKKVVENGETHKINVTYQIDPARMIYATYSTGFRPGGNNRRVQVGPYDSDTLTNIEGGWKTSWLDNHLRFNGAIFFERWKNAQLSVTGVQGITSIVNVGTASSKGIESELSWLPIDNLTLTVSGTYVNARTDQEFCDVDQTTEAVTHSCTLDPTLQPGKQLNAPAGTQLPVTPALKANATARYVFEMGPYKSFVQAAAIHQSSAPSNLDVALNSIQGSFPHFTTFDFSTGTGMSNWHLEAYIENAFDKRAPLGTYAQCAVVYCNVNYREYPIKPMNFGVKFGQKF